METVEMTTAELAALPEYSLTLPTIEIEPDGNVVGTTRWKRFASHNETSDDTSFRWYLGEYPAEVAPGSGPTVPIRWRRIVLKSSDEVK